MLFAVKGFSQSQELEQLRLDLEKLVQMKSMLSNMYNGYQTLAKGYDQITSLAKGNFDLHKNYLDQLLQVSPQIMNSSVLQGILDKRSAVGLESASAYWQYVRSGLFTNTELMNLKAQFDSFNAVVLRKIDQLNKVLTPGSLRMSDSERISAIERVDRDVGEALGSVRALVKEQNAVAALRGLQKKEISSMRSLYGLK